MEAVAKTNTELTDQERTLLALAYKHNFEIRRKEQLVISNIEKDTNLNMGKTREYEEVRDYREKIECEIRDICNGFLVRSLFDASINWLILIILGIAG